MHSENFLEDAGVSTGYNMAEASVQATAMSAYSECKTKKRKKQAVKKKVIIKLIHILI